MDNKIISSAEMVDRKEGYYWVKYNNESEIAYWEASQHWTRIGSGSCWRDVDFEEIDERQICRSENAANICADCGREAHIKVYCNICDNDE
jgi:hypothetical protein